MGSYIFLGIAALTSMLGMGLVSLGFLVVLYFVSESLAGNRSGLSEGHRLYARKTARVGIFVHVLVALIFFGRAGYMMFAGGGFEVMAKIGVLYFIFDHIVEFILGVWLAVKAIRGVLWFNQNKLPNGLAVMPSHGSLSVSQTDQ